MLKKMNKKMFNLTLLISTIVATTTTQIKPMENNGQNSQNNMGQNGQNNQNNTGQNGDNQNNQNNTGQNGTSNIPSFWALMFD